MANVLVVDDEEMDRVLGRAVLEAAGHRVFFASDGEAALKVYKQNAIDVVLTDLKMPKLNGLRLIQEILSADPHAAVIAISGAAADQLDRAKELGAVTTLPKPFDIRVLLNAINEAVKRKKASGDDWGESTGFADGYDL